MRLNSPTGRDTALRTQTVWVRIPLELPKFNNLFQSGGIGKRRGLLILRFGLWVRVPPLEPYASIAKRSNAADCKSAGLGLQLVRIHLLAPLSGSGVVGQHTRFGSVRTLVRVQSPRPFRLTIYSA